MIVKFKNHQKNIFYRLNGQNLCVYLNYTFNLTNKRGEDVWYFWSIQSNNK